MKPSNKRGVSVLFFPVMAVMLWSGCNPCNDGDREIVNVNGHGFSGTAFSVVTFNLLHGFGDAANDATLGDRLGLVAAEIVDTLPDAVLLQEASVTAPERHCSVIETLVSQVNDALSGTGKSYNSIYARANGAADIIQFEEGAAILSLHEILSSDVHIYSHNASSLPDFRVALRVTVQGDEGDIDLFSTHLTNREDMEGPELVRELQARELAQEIIPGRGNDHPVIVGGDFNDPPGSGTILEMTGAGAVDIFAAASPGEAGYTSFADPFDLTDPDAEADKRIDFLFMTGPGGTVTESGLFLHEARDTDPGPGVSWLWASDHIGVRAVFRLYGD